MLVTFSEKTTGTIQITTMYHCTALLLRMRERERKRERGREEEGERLKRTCVV